MSRKLRFEPEALLEFRALDKSIRAFFASKIEQRLLNPKVPKDSLSGEMSGLFKIKQNSSGYRLVYKFDEQSLTVIAVGRREDKLVYREVRRRI